MTHHHHDSSDLAHWQALPEGFVEHLDQEARLSAPMREAALDRAALALGSPPSHIVDLGSGTGIAAVELAERFPAARVHALDVSSDLLGHVASAAEEAGVADRIDTRLVDLNEDWASAVASGVDLVWAALSLHHLEDPDKALHRVCEVLRPGGALVMVELAGDWSQRLTRAGFVSVERRAHPLVAGADPSAVDRIVWIAVRPREDAAGTAPSPEVVETDVAVIGGGPAGLAAAITLARSRRSVVVIDAGQPRNAPAEGAHNVLGNEGIPPHELLAKGRAEAESYGVRILPGRVTRLSGEVDDFTVEVGDSAHRIHARRVILATGLVDDLPEVPGVRDGWGRTVLHCPFCHGWEVRDQRIAILTRDEVAIHQALLFSRLSDHVTVFLHGAEPTEEQWEQLTALGVEVVRPRVERVVVEGTQVRAVRVEGGETFAADAVVVAPRFHARAELYESLGGTAEETQFGTQIPVDPRGATPVPGVWATGNAGQLMAMVVGSAASGVVTGGAVHGELSLADLERVVQVRRARSRA